MIVTINLQVTPAAGKHPLDQMNKQMQDALRPLDKKEPIHHQFHLHKKFK
jgi:hypothetical protein